MSGLLSQLCTVPGVTGAAVFDVNGACIEHRTLPPALLPETIAGVLDDLVVGLEAYAYLDRASFRLGMAHFANGTFIVMRTADFRAVAFASPDIDPSMLEVAFGALEVKLQRLGRRRSRPDSGAQARSESNAGVSPLVESAESSEISVVDRVPNHALEALHDALAEAVGPIARLLVGEHCAELNFSPARLSKDQWAELVESLSGEISDEQGRVAFRQKLTLAS